MCQDQNILVLFLNITTGIFDYFHDPLEITKVSFLTQSGLLSQYCNLTTGLVCFLERAWLVWGPFKFSGSFSFNQSLISTIDRFKLHSAIPDHQPSVARHKAFCLRLYHCRRSALYASAFVVFSHRRLLPSSSSPIFTTASLSLVSVIHFTRPSWHFPCSGFPPVPVTNERSSLHRRLMRPMTDG